VKALPVESRLGGLAVVQLLLAKPRNILDCALGELPTMSIVVKRCIISFRPSNSLSCSYNGFMRGVHSDAK
jgi:hypothetical protein